MGRMDRSCSFPHLPCVGWAVPNSKHWYLLWGDEFKEIEPVFALHPTDIVME